MPRQYGYRCFSRDETQFSKSKVLRSRSRAGLQKLEKFRFNLLERCRRPERIFHQLCKLRQRFSTVPVLVACDLIEQRLYRWVLLSQRERNCGDRQQ